jgi:hypothetical protein
MSPAGCVMLLLEFEILFRRCIFKPKRLAQLRQRKSQQSQTISCFLSIHFSLKGGSCFSLWLLEDAESKDWNSDCRSLPSPRKKNKMQRKCVCMKAVFPYSSSFFGDILLFFVFCEYKEEEDFFISLLFNFSFLGFVFSH